MKPEIISTKQIYQGKIFEVSLAQVKEENVSYEREVITHPGSAVIVPIFQDETIALVRQYRHPAREYLLELPAGSLEKNENPELGARRELAEEIGVTAESIVKLIEFYVSPGFLGEKMYVFLATELADVGQKLEDDELIKIEKIDFPAARRLILENKIEDAKTIIGLTLAAHKLGISFL